MIIIDIAVVRAAVLRAPAVLCAAGLVGCAGPQTEALPTVSSCFERSDCPGGMSCVEGICRGVDGCGQPGDCRPATSPRAPETPRAPPRPNDRPG